MERDEFRNTQFEPPGPVMGGMRWGDGRPRLVDFCQRTGVVYRKFKAEEILPAPVVHVGPTIVSVPSERARAGVEYVYQARAIDSGVNGFTWSFVTSPPPGMEIDRYDGKITWTPAESCRVQVEIRAYTHHGRQARQVWTINVGKAAVVRTVVPHPRFVEALRRKRLRAAGRRPLIPAWTNKRAERSTPTKGTPHSEAPTCAAPATNPPRLRHAAGAGPPICRLWRAAWRTSDKTRFATAPPDHLPAAAVFPLRL